MRIGIDLLTHNIKISRNTFHPEKKPTFAFFRYYAICKPMVAQGRCTMLRAKKIIVVLWCMAVLAAIPLGYEKVK